MGVYAAFRRGNDAIAAAARNVDLYDGRIAFVCECADAKCLARVALTLGEYDAVRERDGDVIMPGHVRG
jgi:hypothetical protein